MSAEPTLVVLPADPRSPGPAALLAQSHALMQELFPPEDNHYLSHDELAAPHIRFFAAKLGEETVGTGALAVYERWGEVKSMFVAPDARGRGVGRTVLSRIEAQGRIENLAVLRLETGDSLAEAHRLYISAGYVPRGPFGDYGNGGSSRFFEKALA